MWWRLSRSQWTAQKGAANKGAFRVLVDHGPPPGILAYQGDEVVGWCAVAPRETYPVLQRSRSLKAIDSLAVWSITCLFIKREHRRKGFSVALLKAASRFVHSQGGSVVEGYPVETGSGRLPDAFAWTGTMAAFERAGFKLVVRRGARPIVRKSLSPAARKKE